MSFEITEPNPRAFEEYRVLFFYDNREDYNHFMPILEMCGLKSIEKFDSVSNAVNELIANDYDMVIMTYLGKAEKSARLVNECRSLSIELPFVAITEKGVGLKNALGIYTQGVDEVVWPPLSANMLGKLLKALVRANRQDRYKEEHTRARELLESGDIDEAEVAYKELLSNSAYRIDASLALSVINVKRGKFNEAKHLLLNAQAQAKLIRNMMKKAFHLSRVIYYMGEMHREQGAVENAIRHYMTALSMNPHLAQAVSRLAQVYREAGMVEELLKLAGESRKTFKDHSEQLSVVSGYLLDQAEQFEDLGMHNKASELFYFLNAYPHGNPDVHVSVAEYFWRKEQYNVVVTRFERLSSAGLKLPQVLAKHGECLLDAQQNHLEYREDESEDDPELGRFMNMRGSVLIDNAKELLQEALLLNPRLTCAWISLIRSYLRGEEEATAAEVLKRFLGKVETDVEMMVDIIGALFEEGAFELGYQYIRESLERYPDEGRFYLFSARYMRHHQKFYEAVGTLKQGLQVDEQNTEMMIQIGDAYMELDQAADAVNFYERASRILPADEEIKRKLTEALIRKTQGAKGRRKRRPLPLGSG